VNQLGAMRVKKIRNPVALIILDGWGIAPPGPYNAITLAKTPNFDKLRERFGSIEVCASGTCVGLTEGQMGNSEVGHLTIGAGRKIFQDLMRVNDAIKSGILAKNKILVSALKKARARGSTVHFLGLLSDGGVHSHMNHLFALLKIASDMKVEDVKIQVVLDGRDTPPNSGIEYTKSLLSYLDSIRLGSIGTISGRYYAMDRDARWDRTKLAYDAIVHGIGQQFEDPIKAIQVSYDAQVTDEFMVPKVMRGYEGIQDGDIVVLFNFRPDRMRQMAKALSQNEREFRDLFDRGKTRPTKIDVVSLTNYDPKLKNVKALLGREKVSSTLSNVLERNHVRQLRVAETEKYAHVTYFFNGLVEKPRKLEDRILVPSLKIGTYDKSPEMSAERITEEATAQMESGKYGFILINFANADMVGHSGDVQATIQAVEEVDRCLGVITSKWEKSKSNIALMVTADHGNAEQMFDLNTNQPHTAHTSNPVPLILASSQWRISKSTHHRAELVDLAPSILKIMGLKTPRVMKGVSLVERK
jgi:2,3-bisphosphoglycerate-independent phosphoglycerate mutase